MKSIFLFLTVVLVIGLKTGQAQNFYTEVSDNGGTNIILNCVTQFDDASDQYIAVGSIGNKILGVVFDNTGAIQSSKMITLVDANSLPVCTSILVDQGDNDTVVICGYRKEASGTKGFVLSWKYTTNTIIWAKMDDTLGVLFLNMIEKDKANYGDYIIAGQTQHVAINQEGIMFQFARKTGGHSTITERDYEASSETFYSVTKYNNGSNDRLFVAARYNFAGAGQSKMRPCVSKFSMSGSQNFSKWYLKSTTSNARLYCTFLLGLQNHFNGLVMGDYNYTANDTYRDLYLFRINQTGVLSFSEKIDFTGYTWDGRFASAGPHNNTANMILLGRKAINGSSLRNIFLISLDTATAATVNWAKSYPWLLQTDEGTTNALYTSSNGHIYVAATTLKSGINDGIIMQPNDNGNLCELDTDEAVTISTATDLTESHDLVEDHTDHISTATTSTDAPSIGSVVTRCTNLRFESMGNKTVLFDLQPFEVYPSPTDGQFSIKSSMVLSEQLTVEIYTDVGIMISRMPLNNEPFDLSRYGNGLYLIKIIDLNGKVIWNKTIIKV